jgi:enterochelin esterase-like enzyme
MPTQTPACRFALATLLLFIQPATQPVEWITAQVRAPRVSFHTFDSRSAGTRVSYHLYTPAAYDAQPDRRFPVVYYLHGTGGGLPGIRPLSSRFDAAIEAGKAPPVLVVFVNGLEGGMYCNWKDGSVLVEDVIVSDLIPHIDAAHRTIATRQGRMLEGFSMGGYGAARLGLKFPELFSAVSMLAAGPLQPQLTTTPRAGPRQRQQILERVYGNDQAYFLAQSPWRLAELRDPATAPPLLIRQIIGDRDETLTFNRDFHQHLTRLGLAHDYAELPDIPHDAPALIDAVAGGFFAFHRRAFTQP